MASKAGGKVVTAKKKRVSLKFTIDCSRPVEDGIMIANDFVSIVRKPLFLGLVRDCDPDSICR